MYGINGINLKILEELIIILKERGIKDISPQKLAEEYNKFSDIYNSFFGMDEECKQYGINIYGIWKQCQGSEKAIDILKIVIETTKEQQLLESTAKEIKQKLDNLEKLIEENYLSLQDFTDFNIEYTNIMNETSSQSSNADKIRKLEELNKKIDECNPTYQLYQQIKNQQKEIDEKVKNIESLIRKNPREKLISFKEKELSTIKSNFDETSYISDPNETTKRLSQISKELDILQSKVEKLSIYIKYDKSDYYQRIYSNTVSYEICGITINIDIESKTCKIIYNERITSILTEYKLAKFKKILHEKLKSIPVQSIIKPIYVNEKNMLAFMKKNSLPLNDILKSNINSLLKELGVYQELSEGFSIEELLKLESNNKLKDFYEFIELLTEEEFDIKIYNKKQDNQEKQPSLSEDISNKYQNIHINPTEILSDTITTIYQNETLVYSSLQIVYNCIDRNIIKAMHDELTNNIPLESAKNLNKVITTMKKYSRNKEDKPYSEEEIINFLKSKNEIVNTIYASEVNIPNIYKNIASQTNEDSTDEYQDIEYLSDSLITDGYGDDYIDLDQILYKLTGRRRH